MKTNIKYKKKIIFSQVLSVLYEPFLISYHL